MAVPLPHLALAETLTRNLVPLAGILFLGWSAPNILILYFVDTLFAMAVLFAGLMRHFIPPPLDDGWAARANAEAGYVGTGLFLAAVVGVPLGIPLLFMLGGSTNGWSDLLADPGFRTGLVVQAISAVGSGRHLYRALRDHTPDQLRLRHRFSFVFLRWFVLVMASFLGIGFLLGRFAALFFVAVYTVATIVIEVAPDRFLRAMPGGADDADPAGAPQAPRKLRGVRRKR